MDHDYPHFVTVKWYGVPDSETLSGRRLSDYLRGYMIGDDCVDREDFLRAIRKVPQMGKIVFFRWTLPKKAL